MRFVTDRVGRDDEARRGHRRSIVARVRDVPTVDERLREAVAVAEVDADVAVVERVGVDRERMRECSVRRARAGNHRVELCAELVAERRSVRVERHDEVQRFVRRRPRRRRRARTPPLRGIARTDVADGLRRARGVRAALERREDLLRASIGLPAQRGIEFREAVVGDAEIEPVGRRAPAVWRWKYAAARRRSEAARPRTIECRAPTRS